MPEAVILSAARTPIGRARKGSLVDVDALDLAEIAIEAAIERSSVPKADIDDLILAEQLQGGGVIGRHVLVRMGIDHVPGAAISRHCAGGLSAVQMAAGSILAGMDDVVVAGGTESLSSMPRLTKSTPASAQNYQSWFPESHPAVPEAPPFDMPLTVGENTARLAGLSREDCDQWACETHRRAARAIAEGRFEAEIVPVPFTDSAGNAAIFLVDENPRGDTTLEKLAALPVLHPELANPTVTAGNSAGVNDAAAAAVLASGEYAEAHGLRPLARIIAWSSVGVAPERTGLAPGLAIPKALERAGMKINDVDVFEVNEAFCSVAVATARALDIDPEILNVNGSGCSLGHPIAATGARMVATMVNELARRDANVGLLSMCAGGGMGSALIIERV